MTRHGILFSIFTWSLAIVIQYIVPIPFWWAVATCAVAGPIAVYDHWRWVKKTENRVKDIQLTYSPVAPKVAGLSVREPTKATHIVLRKGADQ